MESSFMTRASLYCNATTRNYSFRRSIMTAAIKRISFFAAAIAAVSSFSQELYVAHGGYAPAVRG